MNGYLYCFSNKSMPGILKIGITERTLEIRLNEANISDTWRPPTPYKIEFAKKVCNPKQKEKIIHRILSTYRINPKREFFRVSFQEIKIFFDLIDGDEYIEKPKTFLFEKPKTSLFGLEKPVILHAVGTRMNPYIFLKNIFIFMIVYIILLKCTLYLKINFMK